MAIEYYEKGNHQVLREIAPQLPPHHSLRYPEFVDYYYGTNERCKLSFFLDPERRVKGVIGWEKMKFLYKGEERDVSYGSNFVSFVKGTGAYALTHWMKSADVTIVYGGTPAVHRIYKKHRKWTEYFGMEVFRINRAFLVNPIEDAWRRIAKRIVSRFRWKEDVAARIDDFFSRKPTSIEVAEEQEYKEDIFPRQSSFELRFVPDIDHLSWRYDLHLPFTRYRLFRIVQDGETVGYVVINQGGGQVMVAHADAEGPEELAFGILKTFRKIFLEQGGRGLEFVLAAANPVMKNIFVTAGFKIIRPPRLFFAGNIKGDVPFDQETSGWLINIDWGDNGLRAPLLGNNYIS